MKVEDNTVTDFDLTNFLALKRSLELRIGEEIDFDKLEEYVNKLPKDKAANQCIYIKTWCSLFWNKVDSYTLEMVETTRTSSNVQRGT